MEDAKITYMENQIEDKYPSLEIIEATSNAIVKALSKGSRGTEHNLLDLTSSNYIDIKRLLEYTPTQSAHAKVLEVMLREFMLNPIDINGIPFYGTCKIPTNPSVDYLRGMQIDPRHLSVEMRSYEEKDYEWDIINLSYKYTHPHTDQSIYTIEQVVKADDQCIPLSSEFTIPLNFHKIGLLNFMFLPFRANTKSFLKYYKENNNMGVDFIKAGEVLTLNNFDILTFSYDVQNMANQMDAAMLSYLTLGSNWSDKIYEWKEYYKNSGILENPNPTTNILGIGKVLIGKRWYYLYTGANQTMHYQKPKGNPRIIDYFSILRTLSSELAIASNIKK